jgi:hypothetical protein
LGFPTEKRDRVLVAVRVFAARHLSLTTLKIRPSHLNPLDLIEGEPLKSLVVGSCVVSIGDDPP